MGCLRGHLQGFQGHPAIPRPTLSSGKVSVSAESMAARFYAATPSFESGVHGHYAFGFCGIAVSCAILFTIVVRLASVRRNRPVRCAAMMNACNLSAAELQLK